MFDIGFFELLVVAIVGLVVIGPERLPGAVRSGALWWGRLRRTLQETRTELEKQLGADDIRRQLHNEEVMRSLEALRVKQTLEPQIHKTDAADPGEHQAHHTLEGESADTPLEDNTPEKKPHD